MKGLSGCLHEAFGGVLKGSESLCFCLDVAVLGF